MLQLVQVLQEGPSLGSSHPGPGKACRVQQAFLDHLGQVQGSLLQPTQQAPLSLVDLGGECLQILQEALAVGVDTAMVEVTQVLAGICGRRWRLRRKSTRFELASP